MNAPTSPPRGSELKSPSLRIPISYSQRRLWMVSRILPGSPLFNNAHGIRLRGPLESDRLRQAILSIVQRHETLRTSFSADDIGLGSGDPYAVVHGDASVDWTTEDLSAFCKAERAEEVERCATAFARRPFDLESGPLFRAMLIRLADEEHLLILVVHHIVSDRWSVGVLMRELQAFYVAHDATPPLNPIDFTYGDYAGWQQERDASDVAASHLQYWVDSLRDAPPFIDLPADHVRPASFTFDGAVHSTLIDERLTAGLRQLSRTRGVTLFMTCLSAFFVLLHRMTRQSDLVIGTPVAGRGRLETEQLIGFFVNLLPLRAQLSAEQPFEDLLAVVRDRVVGMLQHQETPFDRIVETVCHDRDQSRHPLFDVLFNFHNVPPAEPWDAGVQAQLEEIRVGISRYDLTLTLRPTASGALACEIEYSSELFEPATIAQIALCYQELLRGIVADPAAPVGRLPLLSIEQRKTLLQEWSNPAAPQPPATECAHQSFERQAALTPDSVAIVCGRQRLTYAETNRQVNRLACRLRVAGVGPEKLVAVCLNRTADLPIAIMAILKAGGAYVPLDPSYPPLRLVHMLEIAKPAVLLTERALRRRFEDAAGREVIEMEDVAADTTLSDENPPNLAALSNLAYVIFTSGSTGKPKGVAIEHRGPAELIQWARSEFSNEECAGTLFSTSVSFDVSVFELLPPLARGAKVIVVPNVLALMTEPARDEVTFVTTVPSALTELLRMKGIPTSVRSVGLAGEAMPAALVRACHEVPHITRVYNIYGPTEDTVYSTSYAVPSDFSDAPSIGRAIGGTQVFILDELLQPVPVGMMGQLYLGGRKLARGYLHRDDLTADRFVPSPFAAEGRLYKTGDLCRWNSDGTIRYEGRIDHQVKLRGFRIELGEIESVLGLHPLVSQCRVIVRENAGDQQLVAYVVGAEGSVSTDALRDHLRGHLPAYMIPSAFVVLSEMPLTPSGKIDSAALPAPKTNLASVAILSGAVQLKLGQIWRELLSIDAVGPDDNFFALGGHSLRMVMLSAKLRQEFRVEIPLRALFDSPTIRGIADCLENRSTDENAPSADPEITSNDAESISFGQQRMWFLEQLGGGNDAYNVSLAQRIHGALDLDRLSRAFSAVCDRHGSLRTTFHNVEGILHQRIVSAGQELPVRVVDLTAQKTDDQPAAVQQLLLENRQERFDLARWPLLRVMIVQLAKDEHVLAICLHHIICDDWSLRIILREAGALYADPDANLPSLQWTYPDFARWQRQVLNQGEWKRQSEYWCDRLKGAPPRLPLPVDRPLPALQSFKGRRERVELSSTVVDALRTLSRQEKTSQFICYLASFFAVLAEWTQQHDLVIGTPIANRSRVETHDLVGFFLNTMAIRADVTDAPTFRHLLRQIRTTAVEAYANQDLPFEKLIKQLQLPRDLRYAPLVQAMFVMLNEAPPVLQLSNMEATSLPTFGDVAKFELTLMLSDSANGIAGWFEYNTDLFDAPTIESLRDRWIDLLQRIAVSPDLQLRNEFAQQADSGTRDRICAAAADTAAPTRTPDLESEARLLPLWREVLNVSSLSVEESFFDAGGHSLLAVRLIYEMTQQLGKPFPLTALFDAPTVRRFVDLFVRDDSAARDGEKLCIPLRSTGTARPLFCVPGSGGQPFTFVPLLSLLDASQPVYGLRYPELDAAQVPPPSIEAVAAKFLLAIRQVQPMGPYRLAGYSLGSVFAFEMAQQLQAAGETVELLTFFDGFAPGTAKQRPLWQRLGIHALKLVSSPGKSLAYLSDRVKSLKRETLTTPVDDSPVTRELSRDRLAAEIIGRAYRPHRYDGSILLLQANQREAWHAFLVRRPANGWSNLAGSVEIVAVPGTHLTLFSEANVKILGAALNDRLRKLPA